MEGTVMVKVPLSLLSDFGRLVMAFGAEMAAAAHALYDERHTTRLKAHLDWSEGAQRNRRLRR